MNADTSSIVFAFGVATASAAGHGASARGGACRPAFSRFAA